MSTSKTEIGAKVQHLLCKLITKRRNVCVSCLFGDFNVYGSPLSNNTRLSHKITLVREAEVILLVVLSRNNLTLRLRFGRGSSAVRLRFG